MTAVWPSELPLPLRQGFQRQRGEARQRRRADTGPGGMRRRFSSVIDTMAMTIDVDRYRLGVFDVFFEDTVKRGALPFTMADPITDGWPMLDSDGRQMMDEDEPLLLAKTLLCQFGDQLPVTVPIGNRFRVSFVLDILP